MIVEDPEGNCEDGADDDKGYDPPDEGHPLEMAVER